MRSHPYAAPSPLPSGLDDLADELISILPNRTVRPRRRSSVPDVPLFEFDPDTSRLLSPPPPPRPRHHHHHVRVQGRLVLVRSVSTVSLRTHTAGNTSPISQTSAPPVPALPMYAAAVGSVVRSSTKGRSKSGGERRRRSLDDHVRAGEAESGRDSDDRRRETVSRDLQLRGYGIGGAGNIRMQPSSSWGNALLTPVLQQGAL